MTIKNTYVKSWVKTAVLAPVLLVPAISHAGSYLFAENSGIDIVAHPTGYTGTGGVVNVNVCQVAGGGPALSEWEQPVRNTIATYNQMQATTGNLRYLVSAGGYDFESVALHELGHCIGKGHVNLGSRTGLSSAQRDYTAATSGANATFEMNAAADTIIGSADDIRGDDVNLHWFREANNNPFTMDYVTVDSGTYARDVASLPGSDIFAVNADRTVSEDVYDLPSSEAVMQQGTSSSEAQRTLVPDDVATLLLARSGLDSIQGVGDDYTVQLNYATTDCDVNMSFDDAETGFAVCQVGGTFRSSNDIAITSAEIYFNSGFNWFFNSDAPCQQTISLVQGEWKMFSLPCQVGISTGDTVAEILGDNLSGTFDTDWAVYQRDAENDVYIRLAADSVMETGRGYWVKSLNAGQSFTVEGQYAGSPDIALHGDAAQGRWNLIGHPYDFPVDWSNVRIIDDANIIDIDDVDESTQIVKTFQVWNGNTYQPNNGSVPGFDGTFSGGEAAWAKVYGDNLRLRVLAIAPDTLTTPTGVSTTTGAGKVTVNWSHSGDGQSYQIYRYDHLGGGSCSGIPSPYGWVPSTETTFEDTDFSDPSATGSYCYGVRTCWGTEAYPRMNGCSARTGLFIGTPGAGSSPSVALSASSSEEIVLQAGTQEAEEATQPIGRVPAKTRMKAKKVRDDGAWFVRITAASEGKEDRYTVFGGMPDSIDGKDANDIEKRAPFGESFLSVMFPKSDWEGDEWGFASDYRELGGRPSGEWTFAVYASADVGEVTLSFEGPRGILNRSRLWRDEPEGRHDSKKGNSYTFTPVAGLNYFTIRIGESR